MIHHLFIPKQKITPQPLAAGQIEFVPSPPSGGSKKDGGGSLSVGLSTPEFSFDHGDLSSGYCLFCREHFRHRLRENPPPPDGGQWIRNPL